MFNNKPISYRTMTFWETHPDATVDNILQHFLSESVNDDISIKSLSEAMKFSQLSKLFRRILDSTRNKTEIIDFRDIDKSRGDLEKIEGYKTFNKALSQLRTANSRNDSILYEIEILRNNIINYKPSFKKAYDDSSFIGKCFYRSCVFTFFYAISVYLSSCIQIDIPKTPGGGKVMMSIKPDGEIGKTFVFQSVRKINKYFKDGKVKEFFKKDISIDNGKALIESVQKTNSLNEELTATMLIVGIPIAIFGIVFLIREIIFYFFKFRKYLASEFEIAAEFLELNSELQSDKSIRSKQITMAKRYRKIADAINVKSEITTKQVEKEIKKELVEDKKAQENDDIDEEEANEIDNTDYKAVDSISQNNKALF